MLRPELLEFGNVPVQSHVETDDRERPPNGPMRVPPTAGYETAPMRRSVRLDHPGQGGVLRRCYASLRHFWASPCNVLRERYGAVSPGERDGLMLGFQPALRY